MLAPSYAFKCQGCGAKRRSQAMFCRACKPEGRGGRKTLIPCPRGHVEPDFEGTRKGLPGAPVIDHILPVSKGGKHERSNLQLAHWRCNTIKGNRVEPLSGAPPSGMGWRG